MNKHTMTDSNDHAIEVEGLSKRYGDLVAVNNISFTVQKGEVFAFLGPNGAGKTTTVEIINTVRGPTSGSVRVLGMDVVKQRRDIIPRIGVMPQAFASFDRITVRESVQYYSRLFGRKDIDIDGLIELTNLTDKRDAQFRSLSGGLKQRLGIAIAMVNDPEVIFLDEPTTGLDPRARRAVWDILLGLKNRGKAVFLTTHYMEEAELLADTVAIIFRGAIVATGSPDALIERNANHLDVLLKSVDDRALDTIRRLGFEPIHDANGRVRFQVKDAGEVHTLLGAIIAAGATPSGLDVRKPNLEEVFLSLTGEGLHDTTPAAGCAT